MLRTDGPGHAEPTEGRGRQVKPVVSTLEGDRYPHLRLQAQSRIKVNQTERGRSSGHKTQG